MLKKILVVLGLLIIVFIVIVATRPDDFSVSRTTTVAAPPEAAFAVVNDFHRWPEWSPWEKLDPAMKRTLGGAPAGKGATYAWEGNGKAGAGRMEIVESAPASKVGIQLDFIKPFEGHNRTEFTLTPQGDATQVNW